eukprot:scaffold11338_cov98-Isochrysis_galbana.AAC.1
MAPAGSAPALNPPTSSHQRSSSGASAKKRRRQAGLTSPFLCSQPCTRPGGVVRSGLGVAGGGRMAGGGGGSGGPGGRCKAEGRAGGSLWFGEGTAPSPAPLQHAGPVEVRFKTWVVEAWAAESGPTWASAAASAACCPVATEATGTAPRLGAAAGAAARVAAAEAIGVGARAWAAGSARPPASVGAVAPAGAAPVGVAAPSTGDGCQALVGGRLLGPCDVWHIPTSPLSNGSPREAAGGRAKGEVRGAAAWDRDRTVAAGGSAGGAAGGAASGPVQASAPADAVPSGPMPNGANGSLPRSVAAAAAAGGGSCTGGGSGGPKGVGGPDAGRGVRSSTAGAAADGEGPAGDLPAEQWQHCNIGGWPARGRSHLVSPSCAGPPAPERTARELLARVVSREGDAEPDSCARASAMRACVSASCLSCSPTVGTAPSLPASPPLASPPPTESARFCGKKDASCCATFAATCCSQPLSSVGSFCFK